MTSPAISGQKENNGKSTESTSAADETQGQTNEQPSEVGQMSPFMALKKLLRFANMLTTQGC